MRPKVGTVTGLLRLALLVGAGSCLYRMAPTSAGLGHGGAWDLWSHAAALYALTLLSFAAFPRTRRGDIVKVTLVVSALVEVARHVAGGATSPFDFTADAAGAVLVLVPSYLERFRSAARRAPREPFTLAYSGDRRQVGALRGTATARLAQVGAYARDRS